MECWFVFMTLMGGPAICVIGFFLCRVAGYRITTRLVPDCYSIDPTAYPG